MTATKRQGKEFEPLAENSLMIHAFCKARQIRREVTAATIQGRRVLPMTPKIAIKQATLLDTLRVGPPTDI